MRHSVWIRNLLVATFLSSAMSMGAVAAYGKDIVSNKMAVPLKKAEQLMKQGKYAQADEAIKEAQAIPNASPYEQDIITQLQIASAVKQNKTDAALTGYTHLLSSSRLTKDQRIQTMMAQASLAYRARKYPQTAQYIQQYFKAGGDNPHMQTLLIQSYFLNNDFKSALNEQQKQINTELKNGSVPAETQWQFMVNCQQKLGDQEGLRHSYMQLALHYPKPEYWSHVMNSLVSAKGMTPQVELEVWRFREQAGLLTTADQYMTMAEIAVQAGLPHVGKEALVGGRAKGLLTGNNASRALRLEDYIGKIIEKQKQEFNTQLSVARQEKTSDGLFKLGYDSFAGGEVADGIKIMQAALAKPMTDRNIASLEYALAEQASGDKKKAVTVLKSLTGQNVPAELASLWLMKWQAK